MISSETEYISIGNYYKLSFTGRDCETPYMGALIYVLS